MHLKVRIWFVYFFWSVQLTLGGYGGDCKAEKGAIEEVTSVFRWQDETDIQMNNANSLYRVVGWWIRLPDWVVWSDPTSPLQGPSSFEVPEPES